MIQITTNCRLVLLGMLLVGLELCVASRLPTAQQQLWSGMEEDSKHHVFINNAEKRLPAPSTDSKLYKLMLLKPVDKKIDLTASQCCDNMFVYDNLSDVVLSDCVIILLIIAWVLVVCKLLIIPGWCSQPSLYCQITIQV